MMDTILDKFAFEFTTWSTINAWVRCDDGLFRQHKQHGGLVNPTPFNKLIEIFRTDHWDVLTINPLDTYYLTKRKNMSADEAKNIANRTWDIIQKDEKLSFIVDWLKSVGHTQPAAVSHGLNMIFDAIGCNILWFEERIRVQQLRDEYYDENH